jgi:hypothetical protein
MSAAPSRTVISTVLLQTASCGALTPTTTWKPAILAPPPNSEWSEALPCSLRLPYTREINNSYTKPPPGSIIPDTVRKATRLCHAERSRSIPTQTSPRAARDFLLGLTDQPGRARLESLATWASQMIWASAAKGQLNSEALGTLRPHRIPHHQRKQQRKVNHGSLQHLPRQHL